MNKNLLKKTGLFALALSFAAATLNAQAPTPDLLHYKFGGTGTTVTNYASSPPSGTATGTIIGAQTQTGTIGCMNALVGTGGTSTSDYVNTGWAPNLTGSWTISFWSSNIQPSSTLWYIFGDANSGSFRCFTNGVAGANNWILRGGFTDVLITGAATTTSNMVTFVYNQTAGNITGYINGVATVTVAQTSAPINGAGPFKIGGYSSNSGLSPNGLMSDFRIYTSALTPTQVLSLYTSMNTPTLSISGTNTICAGQSTTLTANGTTTYSWTTGSTTSTAVVTPSVTTSYQVVGTVGSCTVSSPAYTVNVNALPTLTLTASMNTTCVNAGTIALTGSPAGGVYTGTNVAGNVFTPGATAGTFTPVYSYTNSGTGCSNTVTISIVVDLCTGINYLANDNGIELSPNPTNGKFVIEFRNNLPKEIKIIDVLGRTIDTVFSSDEKVSFNMENLTAGVYYAIVNVNNNTTNIKFIVK